MPAEKLYSITAVAAAFGVPVSTLRYYDEIGLVPASQRRSTVRHYDRAALEQLAYVQLWRIDGMLSIEHTAAIIASTDHEQRNDLLRRSREELAERIHGLQQAHDMLDHMTKCTEDDHASCPVIGTYLDERVEVALGHLARKQPPEREAAALSLGRIVENLLGHPVRE
ncbi:MerR family transcriptional regulator [Pseudonocardia spinosispora]|uniref:MerR family transcriptional regulator n=1 Tax=Pseudonocardia spinosispora TaxID=103441 RepID=UPI00041CC335|nr:MerR family transcriptional regulator [Pseudonocardia spinosispora]